MYALFKQLEASVKKELGAISIDKIFSVRELDTPSLEELLKVALQLVVDGLNFITNKVLLTSEHRKSTRGCGTSSDSSSISKKDYSP